MQKILPINILPDAWNTLQAKAEDNDGPANLIGPGWTARRMQDTILLRGESREIARLYAELCK